MALLSLLFFVIVARAAGLPNRRSTDYTVCENEACREVGEAIRRNMNHSHKPCTNFYKYGCGLWSENNFIPANDVQWSERHVLDLKTSNRLKEVLEEQSEYDNLPPIKMVKQYYRSCMDEDAIEKHGLEPIQKLLDAKGGWPIQLGNQKSNNYTWQEVDNYYLQMFYMSSFIDIGCTSKDEDATKFILTVEVQTKSFFDSTIVKRSVHQFDVWERNRLDKVLNAFKRHIGINVSSTDYFADMTDLLNFSRDLRNIGQYEEIIQKETGKIRDVMTIAELQEYYDLAETQQSTARARINWLQMIQLLFKSSNISIDASTPVMVYNKYRLHKLVHLLDVTSTHVIVNYIHWNIVNQFLPYLTKEMRDIEIETTDTEYNITEQKPRWKTCIEDIALEEALSFLFIKKYNSKNMTTALTEMLDDIKAEIKKRILNSTWTSASAKDTMIDKMDNTISLIGYPSWYNNQTALIERYEGLEVGENYFKNKVAATVYEIRREIKDYHKSLNRTVWRVAPISLNAYYTPPMNLIILAAQVQDPYFAPGIPLAVNYGAIGTIIGHKLAHIFNTTETSQAFEERIKCFIDQYNNYTVERSENKTAFQLDEILTKDESIADNIGLETVFAAFQKRKLTAGPQAKLPELTDISDEQLFFLSFANSWCEAITEQYKVSSANTGDHSLSEFRILGTLGNMESFSDAFDCPVGSPMNRGSKCTLWN